MKSHIPKTVFRLKALLLLLIVFAFCKQSYAQVNDLCGGAIVLTSSTVCSNTAGSLTAGTTYTAITVGCGTANRNDVWYSFVAKTTNPVITLSAVSFANPRLQLFSGSCAALTAVICGNTSILPTGLTVGNTYFIRVYASPNATGTFNICVTDPPPPANDDCTGATLLASGTVCANTAGTLLNATATAGVPGDCGAVGSPEVWYKFVAQSAFPTITLSAVLFASPRIQLLSGSCGSWTSLACVSATSLNTYVTPGPGSPLTVGTTYYLRIYTNSAVMSGTAWGFNICITEQAIVDYGKSYVNITKGASGGTVEPGDVLEIRAIYVVKGGTTTLSSFTDIVPVNTTYVPNTLRILTNEAQIYKQWTDSPVDTDPGKIAGTAITINLGSGATNLVGGTVKNTDRPTNFGSTCIMVVSYRVTVNAGATYGVTTINVGGGNISYTNPNGYISNITFPAVNAMVYKNYGICTNTIGSNGILSEFGGTFGSGNPKDRTFGSTKVAVNYTLYPFSNSDPQDYRYGISNNSSSGGVNYSIIPNDPVGVHHVFNVWDIIGDHTGAVSPTAGNPPADTTGGKTGGYMVVINSAFKTDTAFLDTVKNLCPNTYYEYSAWFRNICKLCSGDSTGKGPKIAGYVPTVAGPPGSADSSGVHPNLTFNINGYDYYSTGDILYTGQWVKKGFTYLTGPSETQMIVSMRNNAPGGGGNDWAIDDIGVATCTPNLVLNPSTPTVNVCYGDGASLSADVKSFFNNYTEYIWEKSIDNGVSWVNTGYSGTGGPVFNGTEYVYTAVGPSFIGDSTTHNNIFRLRVASTSTNLADPNCSFSGIRTVKVYVHSCMWVLKTDITGVNGQLKNNFSTIQWQTVNETGKAVYEIEKSTDGSYFTAIGTVTGNALNGTGAYTFTDPDALATPAYYRIKIKEEASFKYTKVIFLSPGKLEFLVKNLVNPFAGNISCNVILPGDGEIRTSVFDMYGRSVKTYKQPALKGINPLKIQDLGALSAGTYFLKIEWQNESVIHKIIKSGQ